MKYFRFTSFLATFVTLFLSSMPLLAQSDEAQELSSSGGGAAGVVGGLIGLVAAILMVVAVWKIFTKAGQPGWASLIPIYNWYILLQVVGRPGWWLILMLIPFVNFVIAIILCVDLAKSFGKGVGFTIGLILLSPIFILILAFGNATYTGPAAAPRLTT